MALEIVWTRRAQTCYARIIEYLETHFTEKEIRDFVLQSHEFFELLGQYPEMLAGTKKHKNVHRGPINRHTILTYRFLLFLLWKNEFIFGTQSEDFISILAFVFLILSSFTGMFYS